MMAHLLFGTPKTLSVWQDSNSLEPNESDPYAGKTTYGTNHLGEALPTMHSSHQIVVSSQKAIVIGSGFMSLLGKPAPSDFDRLLEQLVKDGMARTRKLATLVEEGFDVFWNVSNDFVSGTGGGQDFKLEFIWRGDDASLWPNITSTTRAAIGSEVSSQVLVESSYLLGNPNEVTADDLLKGHGMWVSIDVGEGIGAGINGSISRTNAGTVITGGPAAGSFWNNFIPIGGAGGYGYKTTILNSQEVKQTVLGWFGQ